MGKLLLWMADKKTGHQQRISNRNFHYYSNLPVIQDSAPTRKAPNIPKLNPRLVPFDLNRKLSQGNVGTILKDTNHDTIKCKNTIAEMTDI